MNKVKLLLFIICVLLIIPVTANSQTLHHLSIGWMSNISGNLAGSFYENDIGIDYLFGRVNNLHLYLGFVQLKRWEKDNLGLDELIAYNGLKFKIGYGISPFFPFIFVVANFSGSICGKDNFLGFSIPIYAQYILENGLLLRAGLGYGGYFSTNASKAVEYGRYYHAVTFCLHLGWTFPLSSVKEIVHSDKKS